MRLGAHISAAGGVFKAFGRAEEIGADTLMVYTKSNRQWRAKVIADKDIEKFEAEKAKYADSIFPMVVHAAYLINVASPKPELRHKSIVALQDEIERAEKYGVKNMVFHPGSHMKEGVEAGVARVAEALQIVVDQTPDSSVRICLETMAGQGTNLGATFEELDAMLTLADRPDRLGVCFDTCHVFAAGYDFRTVEGYEKTMAEFDAVVGLEYIHCFHFNDSKHDLGSKRDRHEHLGRGFIGIDGFASFVNDPRWANHPAHLETPKKETDDDGNETDMDPVNLAALRALIQ